MQRFLRRVCHPQTIATVSTSWRSRASYATENNKARWVQVKISSIQSGKSRVRLALPVPLLTFGMNLAQRFVPELKDVDSNEVKDVLSKLSVDELKSIGVEDGNLMTICNDDEDTMVEISVK